MPDETHTPADDLDPHQDRIAHTQPAAPSEVIAAHEAMSAYGDPAAFDAGSSAERHPASVDAYHAMSAYGTGGESRCHQYERRLELNEDDLPHCPFPRQQLKADSEGLWRVVGTNIESEFRFVPVPKDEIAGLAEIEDFILRYEWVDAAPSDLLLHRTHDGGTRGHAGRGG